MSDADHFRNDLIFLLGIASQRYDTTNEQEADIMREVAGKLEAGGYGVFAMNEAENPIHKLAGSDFASISEGGDDA